MKIIIPEEYRGKFERERAWIKPKGGGKCIVQDYAFVFISRWKGHGLLVTNKKVKDELEKRMSDLIEKGDKSAQFFWRITAGTEMAEMKEDGMVELPDYLAEWLGEGELTYEKNNRGVVVRAKQMAKVA